MNDEWDPKGGEFEVRPLLVDLERLRGSGEMFDRPEPRPDSGDDVAKKIMGRISLDLILGKTPREADLEALEARLSSRSPEQESD